MILEARWIKMVRPSWDASRVWASQEEQRKGHRPLSSSQGAETPPGWSGVCAPRDRSADAAISGRLGSEQRGPIILPCCDSKCHLQCSACWEMGVSRHGLTGTVWSEASLGHSCGRIHLSSISSTWLQLNCQQTSIMPICSERTWQFITQTSSYLTRSKNTNKTMLQLVCWRSHEVTVTWCPSPLWFMQSESNWATLVLLFNANSPAVLGQSKKTSRLNLH